MHIYDDEAGVFLSDKTLDAINELRTILLFYPLSYLLNRKIILTDKINKPFNDNNIRSVAMG
ncbi:hypothetical protein SARI_03074 [Salmonella enterica subsp. arizonae serovar 62:z4,z23:-]|uniref:Uncharacterized protein n=1 Tax=Salmonella arizonae (strain ATCC BAA-731 / CDC346-86 / RSK2980) TaxID=41514 RepID=A9MS12_SALAR|nr:hypothetical protein SARI_03074 [Salmonella enterica subsp. arizonae serovar 62:z4,z23:-]